MTFLHHIQTYSFVLHSINKGVGANSNLHLFAFLHLKTKIAVLKAKNRMLKKQLETQRRLMKMFGYEIRAPFTQQPSWRPFCVLPEAFNGQPAPGSPFTEKAFDAECVKLALDQTAKANPSLFSVCYPILYLLKVQVRSHQQLSAELISVDAKPLKFGVINEEIRTVIDVRKASAGHLSAQCSGPTRPEYCELMDNRDGTYILCVQPKELGRHTLTIRYDNENVLGSPFTFNVTNPLDVTKVKVYGPGIDHDILHTFKSNFVVETRGARAGQLTRGLRGEFNVEMQRDSAQERTIHCKFAKKKMGNKHPMKGAHKGKSRTVCQLRSVRSESPHSPHDRQSTLYRRYLFAKGIVNGTHVLVFFDCGAQTSILSTDFFIATGRRGRWNANYRDTERYHIVGFDGSVRVTSGRLLNTRVQFGNYETRYNFHILGGPARDGYHNEVMLGLNFLLSLRARIDLDQLRCDLNGGTHSIPFLTAGDAQEYVQQLSTARAERAERTH